MIAERKVNQINTHVAAGCTPEVTNVIHLTSRKILINCSCSVKMVARRVDINASRLV